MSYIWMGFRGVTSHACADSLCPLCGAVLCVLCWVQSCSWWWSSTFRGRSSRRRGSLTAQTRPVQSQHSILPTKFSGPITTAQSPMAMSLLSVLRGSQAAVGPGVSPEQKLGRDKVKSQGQINKSLWRTKVRQIKQWNQLNKNKKHEWFNQCNYS